MKINNKHNNKGDFNKECNKTICNNQNSKWYNNSNKKYYCASCAILINKANTKFTSEQGFPLCQYDEFNILN